MGASNARIYSPEPASLFRILIVDDDDVILTYCREILQGAGFVDVVLCGDSRRVTDYLARDNIGLVFLDLSMPHISGLELMEIISVEYPQIPIAIITMANEVETAVECMRKGALDYLVKPIEPSRLVSTAERIMEERQIQEECAALKRGFFLNKIQNPDSFSAIITNNSSMKTIFRYIEAIATSRRPVQVTGETGSGKELVARAIHTISQVPGPFVAVNIAGLDDNLLSDTLFGHKKGAYTGADDRRVGLVEKAENGTLFLDEVGDLSPSSQIKLLRLIQEKEYLPLGANAPKNANIRIITATHCDMKKEIKAGRFRKDLFYRFQTHHINIPPLRERLDDLPLLASHFVAKSAEQCHRKAPVISQHLLSVLTGYSYPGNIRELDSMLFDAVSRHESENGFIDEIKSYLTQSQSDGSEPDFPRSKESATNPYISLFAVCQTLPTTKAIGDALAAGMIGLSPSAFNRRLKNAE